MLLRERLPKAVTQYLSDEPPEPIQATFVDERLRECFSDRLFRVTTTSKQSAFLYVLIEHKSTPDHKVGWQLLRYMVEILKQWEKENPNWEQLPAVVPFVFYHGAETWNIPNEFINLVNTVEGWKPYLLNFQFPVLDLGGLPDQKLSTHARLRPWLAVMKYATRKDQQSVVVELLIALLKSAPEDMRSIVSYLINVYTYDKQTLEKIIREVHPEEKEKMMSQFAQEILKEGMQQGIEQGVQQGEAKALQCLLERKFGPLTEETQSRIARADTQTLLAWLERILTANTQEEVLH